MCYRRENRSPRRKTSPPPSKWLIIHQKMQLEYINSNRPSKPNLPSVLKPSKLLVPMRLRRTYLFSNLPDSAIAHSIRHPWHLPMLPKTPSTLNTLTGCGQCLDRNLLSIGVTMGEEMRRDYKDFSKKLVALSNWVGVLQKPLLGFFFLNSHATFRGNEGIYSRVCEECEKSVFSKQGWLAT